MKIRIKTDKPMQWNPHTLEDELIYDTEEEDEHHDPKQMFTGLVISALSPMWYKDVRKITIEVVEEPRDIYSADTNKLDEDGGPYKWTMVKVDA